MTPNIMPKPDNTASANCGSTVDKYSSDIKITSLYIPSTSSKSANVKYGLLSFGETSLTIEL